MAIHVLTTEYVAVATVDVSAYVKSATIEFESDAVNSTTFGDDGWEAILKGLRRFTVNIEFLNDFVDNGLDEDLWTEFIANTATAVAVRPTESAISTANPEYQVSVMVNSHSIGGSVGDAHGLSVSWPGTGTPVRDTTP